jgi:hypothetical protein
MCYSISYMLLAEIVQLRFVLLPAHLLLLQP